MESNNASAVKYVWSTTLPVGTRRLSKLLAGQDRGFRTGPAGVGVWHKKRSTLSDYKDLSTLSRGRCWAFPISISDSTSSVAAADSMTRLVFSKPLSCKDATSVTVSLLRSRGCEYASTTLPSLKPLRANLRSGESVNLTYSPTAYFPTPTLSRRARIQKTAKTLAVREWRRGETAILARNQRSIHQMFSFLSPFIRRNLYTISPAVSFLRDAYQTPSPAGTALRKLRRYPRWLDGSGYALGVIKRNGEERRR